MLGHTTQPAPPSMPVATTFAAALALAAGALLYFSDHDNLDRHWRIAVVMVLSAALLVLWPRAHGGAS
jgi:RsiW-degrading membrane proteinase PrsW (M82 family)